MSKRKNTAGAGSVPAPAGPVDQAQDIIRQLREEVREARGALGDLRHERKAVEQLARAHAEQVIESHVNACIAELNASVNQQQREYGQGIQKYFYDLLDHTLNPQRHGLPEAPSIPELLKASEVIERAIRTGMMKAPTGGTPDGTD